MRMNNESDTTQDVQSFQVTPAGIFFVADAPVCNIPAQHILSNINKVLSINQPAAKLGAEMRKLYDPTIIGNH